MSSIKQSFPIALCLIVFSFLASCDLGSTQRGRDCLQEADISEYLSRPDSLSFDIGLNDQSTWQMEYLRALSYIIPTDSFGVSFDSTVVKFKVEDDQESLDFCTTQYGPSYSLMTADLGCVQSTTCYRTTQCEATDGEYCEGLFIVRNAGKARGECEPYPDTPELALRNVWNAAYKYIERNNRAVIANDRCDGWVGLRQIE